MPKYANGMPIGLADWVRVFVPRLGVWHHGIVRRIYWFGTGYAVEIAHNQKGFGVIASDWYEFADGQTVIVHHRPAPAHVGAILARVESNLGKPYDLFAQNCEHFASFVFTGHAVSNQVKVVGFAALVAIIIGLWGWE
jgi:hypothetical protein